MSAISPFSRLKALLAKETIQMRRDRLTFAMMLGIPLLQLLLFGYAINTDPKHLPTAVVAPVVDRFTRAVVDALELTGYYDLRYPYASAREAERLIVRGEVAFVITIPSDFGRRVARADHPRLLIEADATDPAAASNALAALNTVATTALRHETVAAAAPSSGIEIVVQRRYNPEGVTQYNIIPGLLGVILQMTMVMMTAVALTREIECGTMESLLAMPATPAEIMLGKIVPYLGIGAVQVVVVLGAARMLFGVPFVGSLGLLAFGVLLFVLALVILGYLISTLARSQMQAMQLMFFVFLPSILLSGFMFPFRGMPAWAQWFGELLPLTHFIRLVRAVMLKGAEYPQVAGSLGALALFILIFGALALWRFRTTLD